MRSRSPRSTRSPHTAGRKHVLWAATHPPILFASRRFEELVFARIKFFTAGLPEDRRANYYMEREWRLHDGLAFSLGNIARIFLRRDYCQQFHEDEPGLHRRGLPSLLG
jgi:hypothetical protein